MEEPFIGYKPSEENCWRAMVLYGANVACYKFALAKSILEMSKQQKTFVTLEDLAAPFSHHVIEHLKSVEKQGTSPSSRFLDACRKRINDTISQDEMIQTTVKLGFINVIDAFHIVSGEEAPFRFFTDERKGKNSGISLTDEVHKLATQFQAVNLPHEVESRWRLVEISWKLNISRNLLTVHYDTNDELLFTLDHSLSRIDITSCRKALNGYQKGKCFYCFDDIRVDDGTSTHVDHFLPHRLKQYSCIPNLLDGVWNLVLSCVMCNGSKLGRRVPHKKYLKRIRKRNEWLISSHHPLRETFSLQTGGTPRKRQRFFQNNYIEAGDHLPVEPWKAPFEFDATF